MCRESGAATKVWKILKTDSTTKRLQINCLPINCLPIVKSLQINCLQIIKSL